MRIFKPELFQGKLTGTNYFEGWYHKHVSDDHSRAFAVIPGVSLFKGNRHAFIQYINGTTKETAYIPFNLNDFSWDRKAYGVKIGPNRFSRQGISLDLKHGALTLKGNLTYADTSPYPFRLFSPGIMGWYAYVPFMECHHGVVSMDHGISGALTLNGAPYSFDNGRGYIEKDWGKSFPETWIWLQCNSFTVPGRSVMFSVAKIPWLGKFFIGFLGFVYDNGRIYLFSTYQKSRLTEVRFSDETLTLKVVDKDRVLCIKALSRGAGCLKAPETSGMNRVIKESISSEVSFSLTFGGDQVISDHGVRGGLEIIDTIFDYFKNMNHGA